MNALAYEAFKKRDNKNEVISLVYNNELKMEQNKLFNEYLQSFPNPNDINVSLEITEASKSANGEEESVVVDPYFGPESALTIGYSISNATGLPLTRSSKSKFEISPAKINELLLIINSSIDEDANDETIDQISGTINETGGPTPGTSNETTDPIPGTSNETTDPTPGTSNETGGPTPGTSNETTVPTPGTSIETTDPTPGTSKNLNTSQIPGKSNESLAVAVKSAIHTRSQTAKELSGEKPSSSKNNKSLWAQIPEMPDYFVKRSLTPRVTSEKLRKRKYDAIRPFESSEDSDSSSTPCVTSENLLRRKYKAIRPFESSEDSDSSVSSDDSEYTPEKELNPKLAGKKKRLRRKHFYLDIDEEDEERLPVIEINGQKRVIETIGSSRQRVIATLFPILKFVDVDGSNEVGDGEEEETVALEGEEEETTILDNKEFVVWQIINDTCNSQGEPGYWVIFKDCPDYSYWITAELMQENCLELIDEYHDWLSCYNKAVEEGKEFSTPPPTLNDVSLGAVNTDGLHPRDTSFTKSTGFYSKIVTFVFDDFKQCNYYSDYKGFKTTFTDKEKLSPKCQDLICYHRIYYRWLTESNQSTNVRVSRVIFGTFVNYQVIKRLKKQIGKEFGKALQHLPRGVKKATTKLDINSLYRQLDKNKIGVFLFSTSPPNSIGSLHAGIGIIDYYRNVYFHEPAFKVLAGTGIPNIIREIANKFGKKFVRVNYGTQGSKSKDCFKRCMFFMARLLDEFPSDLNLGDWEDIYL